MNVRQLIAKLQELPEDLKVTQLLEYPISEYEEINSIEVIHPEPYDRKKHNYAQSRLKKSVLVIG